MRYIFLTILFAMSWTLVVSAKSDRNSISSKLASGEIEKAHDLFQENGPPYINEGRSYLGLLSYLNKWPDRNVNKIAYEKSPDDWRVIVQYAITLVELDKEESKRLFYKAIEKGMKPVDCVPEPYQLSYSCIDRNYGQYSERFRMVTKSADEVEVFLRQNIELFPNSMVLQYEFAEFLYNERGKHQEALKYAANVSKNSPKIYYGQYLYLSYLYEQGETERLFAELPRILEVKTGLLHRYNGAPLTNFVLFSKETENTEALLIKLTETFPTNPYVQMAYGIYLEYKGQLEKADFYYKKSIPLMEAYFDLTADFLDNSKFSKGINITAELRDIYVGKSRKVVDQYIHEMLGSIIYNQFNIIQLDEYVKSLSPSQITTLYGIEKNKPDVKPVLFFVFGQYYLKSNFKRAIEIYKEGMRVFPNDDWLYGVYANILSGVYGNLPSNLTLSQQNELKLEYEELQKHRFLNFPTKYDNVLFETRNNYTDEQMDALHRERISLHQNNYYANYYYGKHFLKEHGREEEARIVLENAERILRNQMNENPRDPIMRENLAYHLLEKGETVDAIEQFRLLSLIEQEIPGEQAHNMGIYATHLIRFEDWDNMLEAFLDHLITWETTADEQENYYELTEYSVVDALILNKKVSGIEKKLLDIVIKNPSLQHPYAAYGVYLLKKGMTQEANAMFEKRYNDKYDLLEYLRSKYFKQLEEGNTENVETLKTVIEQIIKMD